MPSMNSSNGSEPRLSFNVVVVTRFRIALQNLALAEGTINWRLAALRRLAYGAADAGMLHHSRLAWHPILASPPPYAGAMTSPALIAPTAEIAAGTNRLVRPRRITMAIFRWLKYCWSGMFWSTVIRTSKPAAFGRFRQASVLQTHQIVETRGSAFVPKPVP